MDLSGKTVGVWGYGISGKSIVKFLSQLGEIKIVVFDQGKLSNADVAWLKSNKIMLHDGDVQPFLERCDHVIPSPGIDIREYNTEKIIAELDLFQQFYTKPVIAVTGTLGKTTVVTLVARAFEKAGVRVAVGGNIGVGIFDLIEQDVDVVLLEASSFQLERCKTFAPKVAVITNLYPNHLDRHGTLEAYARAKENIHCHQKVPCLITQDALVESYRVPARGFEQNWQYVAAILETFGIDKVLVQKILDEMAGELVRFAHRLEVVTCEGGVTFVNDSKATVPEACLAAIGMYEKKRTILLLGGIGKGVDRRGLVSQLSGIKKIICFGKEANVLHNYCQEFNIQTAEYSNLQQSVEDACSSAQTGDTVLLSPAGASFDLYGNYEQRGAHFKVLINEWKKNKELTHVVTPE